MLLNAQGRVFQETSIDSEKYGNIVWRMKKYMEAAFSEAQKAAAVGEVPVGAVIVRNGKIIARGHNMTERLKDPTCSCRNDCNSRRQLPVWEDGDCPGVSCLLRRNRAACVPEPLCWQG